MNYICENCGKIIDTNKLIRYLLENKDRDNNFVVGFFATCSCGYKILIKTEKFFINGDSGKI